MLKIHKIFNCLIFNWYEKSDENEDRLIFTFRVDLDFASQFIVPETIMRFPLKSLRYPSPYLFPRMSMGGDSLYFSWLVFSTFALIEGASSR